MIVVITQSGSKYEIRGHDDHEELLVTRVSDAEVYNLERNEIETDINDYLAHEPILEYLDPPVAGERWTFYTKHGRLQTSPVAFVRYVHEDASGRLTFTIDDYTEEYDG